MYGYVYKTTCLINNKIYIGQHKAAVFEPWYIGSGTLLRNAVIKHGKENFKVELVYECTTINELNEKEAYYIQYFNATDRAIGYNIEIGGKGYCKSASTKEKLRLAHLGKIASKETREKMSLTRMGENNGFYGKHHTEESRQKKGAKSIGRQTFLGKQHKSESIEKMSQIKIGNIPANSVKVLCTNDGNVYDSIARAAKAYNIPDSTVARSIRDGRALRNGLKFIKYCTEVIKD